MTDVAIEVDHLWKKFRRGEMHDSLRDMIPALAKRMLRVRGNDDLKQEEFWALRDLTLQVKRGQSLGVIGPNGAGKSTLLKTLTKVLRPNRGSCRINGRVSALIEVGAGFHPDLTGRENMALSGAILGMSRQEIKAKEDSIIEFAGIPEFIDTPVKRYSSGMTARLGFAIAAHMEPDVLLVDEVLSVGDARFRDKCVRHMRKLVQSNVTVIFISHILDQVQSLCPNTLVLNKGGAVFMGPTSQAVRVYLDLLAGEEKSGVANGGGSQSLEMRDIRVLNAQGQEATEFGLGEPIRIQFHVDIHQPREHTFVQVIFKSISGVYLATATSSFQAIILPNKPGRWMMPYTLDPNPLAQGEFQLEFKVMCKQECLWASSQPRILSIRGGNTLGSLVHITGLWERATPDTEEPVSPPTPASTSASDAVRP